MEAKMNNINLQKDNYFTFYLENKDTSIESRFSGSEDIIIKNRVYCLVNKKDVHNPKTHFSYGWSSNPLDILIYFYEQKSLPSDKRVVENGEYVVLFSDRDSGKFGEAVWKTESPSEYQPGTYIME
jgi:hypothetical protein